MKEDAKNFYDDQLAEISMLDSHAERESRVKKLKREMKDTYGESLGIGIIRADFAEVLRARKDAIGATITERINGEWFVLNIGDKIRVCRLNDKEELNMLSVRDFDHYTANMDPFSTGKDSPGQVWLRSPNRRAFDRLVIEPDMPKEYGTILNLWRGYAVVPMEGNPEPYISYVRRLIPNIVEHEYALNWAAYTIQNPAEPTGSALYLIGDPGSGKTSFGMILAKMFGIGKHAMVLDSQSSLTRDFNGHLANKMLIVGNEVLFRGDKKGAERFKAMITDEQLMVEKKGLDGIPMDNHLSFVLTANHAHAAHIEVKDRRYALIGVEPAMVEEEWVRFYDWLGNRNGYEIVLNYLLSRDVSNFRPRIDIPVTKMLLLNKRQSLQGVGAWWMRCIQEERLVGIEKLELRDDEKLEKKLVYRAYSNWHERNSPRGENPTSDRQFWKEMKLVFGAVLDEKTDHADKRPRLTWIWLVDWQTARANLKHAIRYKLG